MDMNIQRKIAFNLGVTLLLLFLAIGTVYAVPITVPTALNPGDQYRLVFVTSSVTAATSSDIAYYNNLVDTVASTSTELDALGTGWSAIASTRTVSAIENTGTDPVSDPDTPIYNLGGAIVAPTYDVLWSTTETILLSSPVMYDEMGIPHPLPVWTGTTPTGEGSVSGYLGADEWIAFGYSDPPDRRWIYAGVSEDPCTQKSLYSLSDVLTVPAPIPEPSTLVLLGFGLFGLMGFRRKGRKT